MTDASTAACWVAVPEGSPYPLHNLPFGIARRTEGTVGAFVAQRPVSQRMLSNIYCANALTHFSGFYDTTNRTWC